jgi:hypothetical protein
MRLRCVALQLRGGNSQSIPRVDCRPAKSTRDGPHDKYDATGDPPQGGQNCCAALPVPPDQSRRADASPGEEKSQGWAGEEPDDRAARRMLSPCGLRSRGIERFRCIHHRAHNLSASPRDHCLHLASGPQAEASRVVRRSEFTVDANSTAPIARLVGAPRDGSQGKFDRVFWHILPLAVGIRSPRGGSFGI